MDGAAVYISQVINSIHREKLHLENHGNLGQLGGKISKRALAKLAYDTYFITTLFAWLTAIEIPPYSARQLQQ